MQKFIKLTNNTAYYKKSNICYSDSLLHDYDIFIASNLIEAMYSNTEKQIKYTTIITSNASFHVIESIDEIMNLMNS